MNKNKKISNDLKLVEKLIKKDISKEKTISGLYKYIFKSNGKKIRARLNLIASSKNLNKNRIKLSLIHI